LSEEILSIDKNSRIFSSLLNKETLLIDDTIKFTENYLSQDVLSYDTIIADMSENYLSQDILSYDTIIAEIYSSTVFAEIIPIRLFKPDYTGVTLVNPEVLSVRETENKTISDSYLSNDLLSLKIMESGLISSHDNKNILYGRDNPENIVNYAYIRTDYIKERSTPEEIINYAYIRPDYLKLRDNPENIVNYAYIRPDYLKLRDNPENIVNEGSISSDIVYLREKSNLTILNDHISTSLLSHRKTDTVISKDYLFDTISHHNVLYGRSTIIEAIDQAYYNTTVISHRGIEDSNIIHGTYAQEALSAKQTINQFLTYAHNTQEILLSTKQNVNEYLSFEYYDQNIFSKRTTEDHGLHNSYISQEVVYIFANIRPLRTTQVVADIFRTYNDLEILQTEQLGQYIFYIPSRISNRLSSSSTSTQILTYLTPAGNLILAQSYDNLATEDERYLAQDNNY
jgi:hypothetical protein